MSRDPKITKILAIDSHRNGVGGESFYVVLFNARTDGQHRHMMGVVFAAPMHTAIFDTDEIAKGNIAFAHGNSWRGDCFDPLLRTAIAEHEEAEHAKWEARIAANVAAKAGK